jgi:hypothetical protein
MDFTDQLIDVYAGLFASPQGMPAAILTERIFGLSDIQYAQLERARARARWPDPRTARLECVAHTRHALEGIARSNFSTM